MPATIPALVLNHLSSIPKHTKCIVLAGLTAAKKIVAIQWKLPRSLSIERWLLSYLDVIFLELSTARINGTTETPLKNWRSAANAVRDLLNTSMTLSLTSGI